MSIRILILVLIITTHTISFSQSQVERELNQMVSKIAKQLRKNPDVKNLVIDDFLDIDKNITNAGKHLASKFYLSLFDSLRDDMSIIDRSQLERAFGELEMSQSGLLDQGESFETGFFKGIDAVITATLIENENYLNIELKCIELKTLTAKGSVSGKILITPSFKKLLGNDVSSNSSKVASKTNRQTKNSNIQSGPIVIKNCKCTQLAAKIKCNATIETTEDESNFSIFTRNTYISNSSGTKTIANSVSIGENYGNDRVTFELLKNYKVNIELNFNTSLEKNNNYTLTLSTFTLGYKQIDIAIENIF